MRKDTQEALAEHEAELRRELSHNGPVVLDTLRKAGLEVSSIERGKGSYREVPWLLRVRPPEHFAQAFELAPEVLVLLVPGGRAQARDIEQAEATIARGLRLDRSLVLVISADADAAERLDVVVRATQRQYLFITIDELHGVGDPQQWLRRFLREQLASADLFAPGPPVVGWDFFGRADELERLRQHIVKGRPVGLYGLRKVGKTSLALRELARLSEETRKRRDLGTTGEEMLGLHIDMQAIGPVERNLAGFMRALVRAFFQGLESAGIPPKSLKVAPKWGKLETLREAGDDRIARLGQDVIELAVDWARRGDRRRVVMFIDEYEQLFDRETFPMRDSLRILEYLRGLVQKNPKSFSFIIAGLTRRFASQSMIGRKQNPLFNFVVDFPLGGLRQDELRTLLRRIGSRLGLDFDSGAIEEIWEQTGGHPALARDYGRVIDLHVGRESRAEGVSVDRSLVIESYDAYARQVDMSMLEIARSLEQISQRSPDALRDLVASPGSGASALRALSPEVVDQLRRFGILSRAADGQGWRLVMKSFGAWLLANYPGTQVASLTG